jgi:hypothetical protein
MKTAEECLELLQLANSCPDVALTETIAIIQLDAFKAGMTRAAKIANNYDDGCMSDISVNLAHKAILAERDDLKEL